LVVPPDDGFGLHEARQSPMPEAKQLRQGLARPGSKPARQQCDAYFSRVR